MSLRSLLENILQKPREPREKPSEEKAQQVVRHRWVKALAVGQYSDESEGKTSKAWWIKSPQGSIVYDVARGVYLAEVNTETLECEPLPSILPDEDAVQIEYRAVPSNVPVEMWPLAKTILILEDGRVFAWPERFPLYKESLKKMIQEAMEFFKDEKWDSLEADLRGRDL